MIDRSNLLTRMNLTPADLAELCQRWKISELSVFGSIASDHFTAESDVDVLVTFDPSATWNLWDLSGLRLELEKRIGRHIDLLEADAIRNPFIRKEVISTKQVLYAA
jgi:predicted nucleotidyltransferase